MTMGEALTNLLRAVRAWALQPALDALAEINKKEKHIMSQLDDLNAAIQAEDVTLQQIVPVVAKIDADITALLARPGLPPDLSAQIQAIQSHTSTLSTALQQLTADDAKANPAS